MKIIIVEQVLSVQIMVIKKSWDGLFYVVVELVQNYPFSPKYVSKPFKTKKAAMNNFNKTVIKYKERLWANYLQSFSHFYAVNFIKTILKKLSLNAWPSNLEKFSG